MQKVNRKINMTNLPLWPHYVNTIEKTTDENFKTEAEKHTIPFVYPYVKEGGKVLDIGAGFGNILFLLRKLKNAEIHGIEPDPFSRGLAKEKLGIDLSGKGVEDFLKFEINEGKKYDYVHLEQVFEHLLSPLQSLREIAQILNPQGVLYIGVPGQYNYTVAPDRFFELAHTYGYTPATLNKFAKQAGMKIIKVKDPMSSNLEVLMALENSIYFEEDRNRLAQGEIWWDTKNRLIYRIKYFKARAILKETIKKYLGENVNNFLRKIIS
jgi:SAM-dependent methyltransferase